jgi:sulfur carrier protein ThiS adenylyltransferase
MRDKYFYSNPPGVTDNLKGKHIFIAGAGGLGSNAAMLLIRAGADKLTIIDFDKIEHSNINRQFYFRDQVGLIKVEALKINLERINPDINVEILNFHLTKENCATVIPQNTDLILECFDSAESKAMLASFALKLRPEIPIITVSGLAGAGPIETIQTVQGPGKMVIIGDGTTEATPENGTLSSRVMYVSSIQTHLAIEILTGQKKTLKV